MRKYLFEDMALASFGNLGESAIVRVGLHDEMFNFRESKFNAERDTWPYPDESFDLVISCEMLEHLVMDPMHVFSEANRVLRHGGRFFVSTPNASCFQNVVKLLHFQAQSLAPHYRFPANFEGIYLRHNRELTPLALEAMFRAAGFQMERTSTTDSYPFNPYNTEEHQISHLRAIFGDSMRGDTLNYTGIKCGPVEVRYPIEEELYLASDHTQAHEESPRRSGLTRSIAALRRSLFAIRRDPRR